MAKGTIEIEIDVPEGTGFTDAIVSAAAAQLVARYTDDEREQLRALTRQIFSDAINAKITGMLDAAVERAVQATDTFGNPKGEPTTLHEVVVKRAEAALRERRGDYGKPTLLDSIIREEIDNAWKKDLSVVVKEAADEVRGIVKERAAEILTETMARARG